jgi:D-sedoheptulose 7-phosphate isomerase
MDKGMLGATLSIAEYLALVQRETGRLDHEAIDALAQSIFQRYWTGRFVYVIGNGGSGANSSHLCEDLGKGTVVHPLQTKRLKILSLTDNTSYILAWANDTSYERIFVEQLRNLGEPGDLLIAISGSGNSPNVLRAVEWANDNGIETFGVTGYSGGQLKQIAQRSLHVALNDMGVVETLHMAAFHWVVGRVHQMVKDYNQPLAQVPLAA